MDVFNRKKIKELGDKLHKVENERDRLKIILEEVSEDLKRIAMLKDTTPKDCIEGPFSFVF